MGDKEKPAVGNQSTPPDNESSSSEPAESVAPSSEQLQSGGGQSKSSSSAYDGLTSLPTKPPVPAPTPKAVPPTKKPPTETYLPSAVDSPAPTPTPIAGPAVTVNSGMIGSTNAPSAAQKKAIEEEQRTAREQRVEQAAADKALKNTGAAPSTLQSPANPTDAQSVPVDPSTVSTPKTVVGVDPRSVQSAPGPDVTPPPPAVPEPTPTNIQGPESISDYGRAVQEDEGNILPYQNSEFVSDGDDAGTGARLMRPAEVSDVRIEEFPVLYFDKQKDKPSTPTVATPYPGSPLKAVGNDDESSAEVPRLAIHDESDYLERLTIGNTYEAALIGEPQRFTIYEKFSKDAIQAQFNPEMFDNDVQVEFNRLQSPGSSYEHMQYVNTKNYMVEMELFWTIYTDVDLKYCEAARKTLFGWCYPQRSNNVHAQSAGVPVLFAVWPNLFSMRCYLLGVHVTNEAFRKDGAVMRWRATIKLEECSDAWTSQMEIQRGDKRR